MASSAILKLKCYSDKKYNFIKWIDNYVSMTHEDKQWEELHLSLAREKERALEQQKLTWWQRLKRYFYSFTKEFKQKQYERQLDLEWREAFEYFKAIEDEMMGNVYEKMGLPRNGVRPDYC